MTPPRSRAAVFAHMLRVEMSKQDVKNREMGRRTDPGDPERGRRRVRRHLSGKHFPSPQSRIAYAVALGLPADFFEVAGEQAEPQDLDERLMNALREIKAVQRDMRTQQARERMSA